MFCRRLLSYIVSHSLMFLWSSTLALSLASFRALSLALLFSLSFCFLVNGALVVDFVDRSCHSCPSSPVAAAVDDPLSADMHMTVIRMWLSIKPQATCIWNKIYRYAQLQHRRWVRPCGQASQSSMHVMPGLYDCCMHGSSRPCALQDVYTEATFSPSFI